MPRSDSRRFYAAPCGPLTELRNTAGAGAGGKNYHWVEGRKVKYPQGDNSDTSLERAGRCPGSGLIHLCLLLHANSGTVKEEERAESRAGTRGEEGNTPFRVPARVSAWTLISGSSAGIPGRSGLRGEGQGRTKGKAREPESPAASVV